MLLLSISISSRAAAASVLMTHGSSATDIMLI
jgi:hypothetical protein